MSPTAISPLRTPPMPEHTSFFSYLIAMFPGPSPERGRLIFGELPRAPARQRARHRAPRGKHRGDAGHRGFDSPPCDPTLLVQDKAVLPDAKCSPLRTFFEVWVGYWYGLMKDLMGLSARSGTSRSSASLSVFILFSNFLGLVPGFAPAYVELERDARMRGRSSS